MLRTTGPAPKPDIQRVVDGLLKEDSSFDRQDNRSAHRENLVRAVVIELRDPAETVNAFSRNISATGIGVITDVPVPESASATLGIAALSGEDKRVLAECRWCKPYGKWYLSGWQFISLKR